MQSNASILFDSFLRNNGLQQFTMDKKSQLLNGLRMSLDHVPHTRSLQGYGGCETSLLLGGVTLPLLGKSMCRPLGGYFAAHSGRLLSCCWGGYLTPHGGILWPLLERRSHRSIVLCVVCGMCCSAEAWSSIAVSYIYCLSQASAREQEQQEDDLTSIISDDSLINNSPSFGLLAVDHEIKIVESMQADFRSCAPGENKSGFESSASS